MKNIISNTKFVTVTIVLLLVITITLLYCKLYSKINTDRVLNDTNIYKKNPEVKRVLSEEELVSKTLAEQDLLIEFYANVFGISKDILINKLIENKGYLNILEQDNFDILLIDYLLGLEKEEKDLFNKKIIPCNDSKEYMVALIKYFTSIYPSVDFNIAAAIAEIESGYSAKGMLNVNNIFGGMTNGGLIRYPNIEYGILMFVKMLNDGYFNKGLNTVDAIGYVYNPTYNESGVKVASPTWVTNVSNATSHYSDMSNVDIMVLKSLKEIS